jgi:hypothetical protein
MRKKRSSEINFYKYCNVLITTKKYLRIFQENRLQKRGRVHSYPREMSPYSGVVSKRGNQSRVSLAYRVDADVDVAPLLSTVGQLNCSIGANRV